MTECLDCEFYCTTPPYVGWCNVKRVPVTSNYYCANFYRRNNVQQITIIKSPYETLLSSMSTMEFHKAVVSAFSATILNEAESLLREEQNKKCFACGSPLKIETRGRRKYCAVCGCYLPEIIYGDQFRDATKMVPVGG